MSSKVVASFVALTLAGSSGKTDEESGEVDAEELGPSG